MKDERGGGPGLKAERTFVDRLNDALSGVVYSLRTQPNMRAHAFTALLVLVAGITARATPVELALLTLTIVAVMVAEMVNTAVETVVDLITSRYHPLARIAKNVAAGAVLLAAAGAVVVGVLIFFTRLARLTDELLASVRGFPETATLAALGAVLIVAILIKAGAPRFHLQGGFPSLHTALAASLATLVGLLGGSPVATLLAIGLVALVGQARVEARIHTFYEVAAGGVIGFLLTLVIVRLLS